MSGDAKFGLLLGVGIVVAAALAYYRPESQPSSRNNAAKASAPAHPKPVRLSKMTHAGDRTGN